MSSGAESHKEIIVGSRMSVWVNLECVAHLSRSGAISLKGSTLRGMSNATVNENKIERRLETFPDGKREGRKMSGRK